MAKTSRGKITSNSRKIHVHSVTATPKGRVVAEQKVLGPREIRASIVQATADRQQKTGGLQIFYGCALTHIYPWASSTKLVYFWRCVDMGFHW